MDDSGYAFKLNVGQYVCNYVLRNKMQRECRPEGTQQLYIQIPVKHQTYSLKTSGTESK